MQGSVVVQSECRGKMRRECSGLAAMPAAEVSSLLVSLWSSFGRSAGLEFELGCNRGEPLYTHVGPLSQRLRVNGATVERTPQRHRSLATYVHQDSRTNPQPARLHN